VRALCPRAHQQALLGKTLLSTLNLDFLARRRRNFIHPLDLGATAEERAHAHMQEQQAIRRLEDELEGALDDLKDEGVVDLPPHACRYGFVARLTYAAADTQT
jgi:hypothetical protein